MITIARISLAAIVVTITFGARAVSAQYAACTGCANLTDAAPVCGADGASYASECEAVFCGESLAVCSGECPCTDGEDPATDSCSDVTFARTGHQYGPEGAYAAMADVAWPAACCAHCDMDADCVSYTWTSMYFDGTPTCYLYATPVEPTKPGTAYPYCFSGNKLPADYASGMDMPEYWRAMAISSGNDPMRMGFSGDSNQWFLDGMASCVGWGEYNDVCASDELVCAADKLTNTCYGFGSEQMDVIHDLFHWNIDRHYQCPGCFYPEQDGEVMACVAHGAPAYMPAGVPEMFGLALPGSVSPHNPGNFVDCGCVEYHMGRKLVKNAYWWTQAIAAGVDPTRLTRHAGMWFYDHKWTCVANGVALDACDDAMLFCAGSFGRFGSASQQLGAVKAAISEHHHKHASCPV